MSGNGPEELTVLMMCLGGPADPTCHLSLHASHTNNENTTTQQGVFICNWGAEPHWCLHHIRTLLLARNHRHSLDHTSPPMGQVL